MPPPSTKRNAASHAQPTAAYQHVPLPPPPPPSPPRRRIARLTAASASSPALPRTAAPRADPAAQAPNGIPTPPPPQRRRKLSERLASRLSRSSANAPRTPRDQGAAVGSAAASRNAPFAATKSLGGRPDEDDAHADRGPQRLHQAGRARGWATNYLRRLAPEHRTPTAGRADGVLTSASTPALVSARPSAVEGGAPVDAGEVSQGTLPSPSLPSSAVAVSADDGAPRHPEELPHAAPDARLPPQSKADTAWEHALSYGTLPVVPSFHVHAPASIRAPDSAQPILGLAVADPLSSGAFVAARPLAATSGGGGGGGGGSSSSSGHDVPPMPPLPAKLLHSGAASSSPPQTRPPPGFRPPGDLSPATHTSVAAQAIGLPAVTVAAPLVSPAVLPPRSSLQLERRGAPPTTTTSGSILSTAAAAAHPAIGAGSPAHALTERTVHLQRPNLKVRIVTWNHGNSVPKGDLEPLLGRVGEYIAPEAGWDVSDEDDDDDDDDEGGGERGDEDEDGDGHGSAANAGTGAGSAAAAEGNDPVASARGGGAHNARSRRRGQGKRKLNGRGRGVAGQEGLPRAERIPPLPHDDAHPYHLVVVAGQECPWGDGKRLATGVGLAEQLSDLGRSKSRTAAAVAKGDKERASKERERVKGEEPTSGDDAHDGRSRDGTRGDDDDAPSSRPVDGVKGRDFAQASAGSHETGAGGGSSEDATNALPPLSPSTSSGATSLGNAPYTSAAAAAAASSSMASSFLTGWGLGGKGWSDMCEDWLCRGPVAQLGATRGLADTASAALTSAMMAGEAAMLPQSPIVEVASPASKAASKAAFRAPSRAPSKAPSGARTPVPDGAEQHHSVSLTQAANSVLQQRSSQAPDARGHGAGTESQPGEAGAAAASHPTHLAVPARASKPTLLRRATSKEQPLSISTQNLAPSPSASEANSGVATPKGATTPSGGGGGGGGEVATGSPIKERKAGGGADGKARPSGPSRQVSGAAPQPGGGGGGGHYGLHLPGWLSSHLHPDGTPRRRGPYALLVKERMYNLYLAVYVFRGCLDRVRGHSRGHVKDGLLSGRVGNKGGVGISVKLGGMRLLFVNAHLAAHDWRLQERLANVTKIKRELVVDTFLPSDDPRTKYEDVTEAFDHCFWFGDLNFRIDITRKHADWLMMQRKYDTALQFDQLRKVMRETEVFAGFREAEIRFPPTFKYDILKTIKAKPEGHVHRQRLIRQRLLHRRHGDQGGAEAAAEGVAFVGAAPVTSKKSAKKHARRSGRGTGGGAKAIEVLADEESSSFSSNWGESSDGGGELHAVLTRASTSSHTTAATLEGNPPSSVASSGGGAVAVGSKTSSSGEVGRDRAGLGSPEASSSAAELDRNTAAAAQAPLLSPGTAVRTRLKFREVLSSLLHKQRERRADEAHVLPALPPPPTTMATTKDSGATPMSERAREALGASISAHAAGMTEVTAQSGPDVEVPTDEASVGAGGEWLQGDAQTERRQRLSDAESRSRDAGYAADSDGAEGALRSPGGGGRGGEFTAGGRDARRSMTTSSSLASFADAVPGVPGELQFDSSSKQRVPSWTDRVLWRTSIAVEDDGDDDDEDGDDATRSAEMGTGAKLSAKMSAAFNSALNRSTQQLKAATAAVVAPIRPHHAHAPPTDSSGPGRASVERRRPGSAEGLGSSQGRAAVFRLTPQHRDGRASPGGTTTADVAGVSFAPLPSTLHRGREAEHAGGVESSSASAERSSGTTSPRPRSMSASASASAGAGRKGSGAGAASGRASTDEARERLGWHRRGISTSPLGTPEIESPPSMATTTTTTTTTPRGGVLGDARLAWREARARHHHQSGAPAPAVRNGDGSPSVLLRAEGDDADDVAVEVPRPRRQASAGVALDVGTGARARGGLDAHRRVSVQVGGAAQRDKTAAEAGDTDFVAPTAATTATTTNTPSTSHQNNLRRPSWWQERKLGGGLHVPSFLASSAGGVAAALANFGFTTSSSSATAAADEARLAAEQEAEAIAAAAAAEEKARRRAMPKLVGPRRGEVECLLYKSLDDREMRILEARSDHRPVLWVGAIGIGVAKGKGPGQAAQPTSAATAATAASGQSTRSAAEAAADSASAIGKPLPQVAPRRVVEATSSHRGARRPDAALNASTGDAARLSDGVVVTRNDVLRRAAVAT